MSDTTALHKNMDVKTLLIFDALMLGTSHGIRLGNQQYIEDRHRHRDCDHAQSGELT